MSDIDNGLLEAITKAKQAESAAKKVRVELETHLFEQVKDRIKGVGTTNIDTGAYSIKIVSREAHKIDSTMLEEIAVENNLEKYLSTFFRWKPEINKVNWSQAEERERLPFTQAVTTTIGKPSITITENIEV